VVLPDDFHGKADCCFVDDIISCAVDDGDNLLRLKAAAVIISSILLRLRLSMRLYVYESLNDDIGLSSVLLLH
jgi:hypothetical protein